MDITLNDTTKQIAGGITVQQLLDTEIPEKQKGIAVAVNDIVVPKINWGNIVLKEADSVLIIRATQGG